jgi:hypothetical protein
MKASIRIQISVIGNDMAESGEVIRYFYTEIGDLADVEKNARNISGFFPIDSMLRTAIEKFIKYNEVK